jgi:hypothetical protein
MTLTIPSGLRAQQAGYSQTNLVSNAAGVANTTDPQLLNPWGISILLNGSTYLPLAMLPSSTIWEPVSSTPASVRASWQRGSRYRASPGSIESGHFQQVVQRDDGLR